MKKNYSAENEVQELELLDHKIRKNEEELQRLKKKWYQKYLQFQEAQSTVMQVKMLLKKPYKFARAFGAYLLGRRNPKRLYSRTYKSKHAENIIKPYKYRLYQLGFIDRTLKDLAHLLEKTSDRYLKRQVAWELALWHAGQYSIEDAKKSLFYLKIALKGEKRTDQVRRIALLMAECYEKIGERKQAKKILDETLCYMEHPDLYFAYANLEENIQLKLKWMNKVFLYYRLQPITFQERTKRVTYENLQTKSIKRSIESGPKVSIILPAYNFASGIQIAIESILEQTWKNIELIIVDDCSTDDTIKVVQRYMEMDPRIKLLSTERNSGPYVARNIGLQASTGEFVTVNDADDWSHAEKIEIQAMHLINHPHVIANSSEHARITDELKIYRRGTMGTYIFSNMSSLMFRKEPVLKKIGYWDSVRFAADGEFKRRLIQTFGKERIVDLKTGPLSLPRQSEQSLTGHTAFGYQGHFMGARKEYVESMTYFHKRTQSLYYPFPQKRRPFPVPIPMLPEGKLKSYKTRYMDVIIASDFRRDHQSIHTLQEKINIHKQLKVKTGIVQISCYNMDEKRTLLPGLRDMVDGEDVQMLVYGEQLTCDVLVIIHPFALLEEQRFLPEIRPKMVVVIVDEIPQISGRKYPIRDSSRQIAKNFGKRGLWFSYNQEILKQMKTDYAWEIRYVHLAKELWCEEDDPLIQNYQRRLDNWLLLKA